LEKNTRLKIRKWFKTHRNCAKILYETAKRQENMDFYTIVLRKSHNYWVALCLENGIVGQGVTQEDSIRSLKAAVDSFEEARSSDEDIYCQPISINELHEFLTVEGAEPLYERYELRAISA
jgi:hypothetical protein